MAQPLLTIRQVVYSRLNYSWNKMRDFWSAIIFHSWL
jgi:hypothetical protein